MRCAICGGGVLAHEPHVPTSDGLVVHIRCADREAARAWRGRWLRALSHLLFMSILIMIVVRVGATSPAQALLLAALWLALHLRLHARFWRSLARDVGRWLRG